jgi:hypothetical protein
MAGRRLQGARGSNICEHEQAETTCKECGGSRICMSIAELKKDRFKSAGQRYM